MYNNPEILKKVKKKNESERESASGTKKGKEGERREEIRRYLET